MAPYGEVAWLWWVLGLKKLVMGLFDMVVSMVCFRVRGRLLGLGGGLRGGCRLGGLGVWEWRGLLLV